MIFSTSVAMPVIAVIILVLGGWLSFESYRPAKGA
jgi:hypothetical protein